MKKLSTMAQQIYDLIKEKKQASFNDLMEIHGFSLLTGKDVHLTGYPSIILWTNVNPTVISALEELQDMIKPQVCDISVYDESLSIYPVVKTKTKLALKRYKKAHWLPVVFTLK